MYALYYEKYAMRCIKIVMAAKKSKYYEMCYIIHTIGNLTVFC